MIGTLLDAEPNPSKKIIQKKSKNIQISLKFSQGEKTGPSMEQARLNQCMAHRHAWPRHAYARDPGTETTHCHGPPWLTTRCGRWGGETWSKGDGSRSTSRFKGVVPIGCAIECSKSIMPVEIQWWASNPTSMRRDH